MLTRSLVGLAVTTAFMGTAAHAADPSFSYSNQTGVEQAEAISAYSRITADASSVTFKETVGQAGALPGITNGTVSATNASYLVFEKGLYAGSSGARSPISVASGSTVVVNDVANFSCSGSASVISLADDSTLRFADTTDVSIKASGSRSTALSATSSTIQFVNAEDISISASGADSTALSAASSTIDLINSNLAISYINGSNGVILESSTLKLSESSSFDTGNQSTSLQESTVSVTSGSSYTTTRIQGSGTLEAEGGSTISVSRNMEVDGSVSLTDSSLSAQTATISNGGLEVAGQSTYTSGSLALNNADMNLSGETGQKVDISSLTGGNVEYYLGNTQADITIDSVSVTNLTLHASGDVNDAVSGDANEALSQFGITNLQNTENVALQMDEGMYTGETTGVVGADGVSNVTTKTNTLMQSNLELASAAPLALNRIMLTDLRKRMGDIRSDEGNYGAWARYDGGRLSGSNGLENNFHSIHIGGDAKLGQWRLGAGFSYTNGDVDYARGNADMDAYGLELYGMWLGESGQFVDIVARVSSADTDMQVDASKTGSMDTLAYSLSAEFGWRFALTEQFYVEPQVEAAYTYIDTDDLNIDSASYEFDTVNSLTGRAGFAAGVQFPDKIGDLYVHASVVHEFSGDAEITGGNGSKYSIDGQDTWYEYGLGATFHLTDSTYMWADLQRTSGAVLDEDWRANVGVRYSF